MFLIAAATVGALPTWYLANRVDCEGREHRCPAFFTTSSAARGARTNAQTTPSLGSDDEARAAELRRMLLAPTRPDPSELMMKWHDLFAGP